MNEVNKLVQMWHRGQRSPIVSAYQNRPSIFAGAPKGAHPMRPLYRGILMEHHILGEMWDKGVKEKAPFCKLEVWYDDKRHCPIPAPITKFIFEVTFQKIIPWSERVVALDGSSVLCKEQEITPENIILIQNDQMSLHGEHLAVFLSEYRRRKG